MNKTLKKTLLIAGIAVAVCAAVWGGLTLARNAQRGDVNVYQVSDFAMTDYWGDTANTSGTVNTDKLQKIYISETQEVSAIYVKEGQNVKKGDKLLAYDSSLSQAQVEQAEIDLEGKRIKIQDEVTDVICEKCGRNMVIKSGRFGKFLACPGFPECTNTKHNLELYREAENKEKLQLRYDTQYAKLEALIQAQDKEAGRYEPVKEGLLSVEGSNGKTKSTPLYYQMLEDNGTQEYYLTDEFIRTKILKHRTSAYVVLVEKAGNVNNGAVTCYGMYLVADDTAAPVKLKMLSDLPPYQDDYSTKNTEEIKEARKELDKIKELLDTSFTKEELKALIASTEKEVYSTQRAVRRAQIELDKKKKELGDGNVYSEIDEGGLQQQRACGGGLRRRRLLRYRHHRRAGSGYRQDRRHGADQQLDDRRKLRGQDRGDQRFPREQRQLLGRRCQQQRVLLPL